MLSSVTLRSLGKPLLPDLYSLTDSFYVELGFKGLCWSRLVRTNVLRGSRTSVEMDFRLVSLVSQVELKVLLSSLLKMYVITLVLCCYYNLIAILITVMAAWDRLFHDCMKRPFSQTSEQRSALKTFRLIGNMFCIRRCGLGGSLMYFLLWGKYEEESVVAHQCSFTD